MILILMVDGARAVISFCILSAIPGYMVVPPDLTVGKLIGLLKGGGGSSGGHLLLKVKGNIAELLLDVTDNLTLGGGGERVASLGEDLHQIVGKLTSSKIKTDDGVGESITLVDGDTVGDTISRVHDNTSGTSGGVEGEDSLDGDVH